MYPQMDENHRNLTNRPVPPLGNVSLGFRRDRTIGTFSMVSPYDDPDTIAVIADHNKAPGRAPRARAHLGTAIARISEPVRRS